MQQISLSQRVTKNELEGKIDGLKNGMEAINVWYIRKNERQHGIFEECFKSRHGRFDKVATMNAS